MTLPASASAVRVQAAVCPLCGDTTAPPLAHLSVHQWNYLRCPGCGLVFVHPKPSLEALHAFYNSGYEVDRAMYQEGIRRAAGPLLDALGAFAPPGRMLEIGCSHGNFLAAARERGWRPSGVELNHDAATHARTELRLDVFSGRLEEAATRFPEPFDAVVMSHVIEHVTDPLDFLRLCHDLTMPGGLLLLRTPNAGSLIARWGASGWQWLCPPAHLYLFSPANIGNLLQGAGFEAVLTWTRQGDAHNNGFEFVCSVARRLRRSSPAAPVDRRSTMARNPAVRIASVAANVVYWPMRRLVDPWLERRGLQPELVVIGRRLASRA